MNTKHWKSEAKKILGYSSDEELQIFLRECKKIIGQKGRGSITPLIVAIAIVKAHKSALKSAVNDEKKVYREVKHLCIKRYWSKFKELVNSGWGSRRIANYFAKMGCKVTHTTVHKYAKMLKKLDNDG
jgi:hypothetical protein